MAPGIYKSFRKAFKKNITKAKTFGILDSDDMDRLNYISTEDKDIDNYLNPDFDLDEVTMMDSIQKLIELTVKDVETETYQAMEGFVHNLNTLHSRAGAQVVFSSINLGTDVTEAGRLVTKNLLLAMEAGLGNGETPIFPIVIFKVKDGVNYNPEDKNYDLFKLAMKVTAKRLYPNFVFEDAPFNLQYYKPGHPETEVATMGCVQHDELVTYKFDGQLFVESIGRMYERLSYVYDIKYFGESIYLDTNDRRVQIYDTYRGFVGCKKVIVNPNKNNWYKLKLSNGRLLTCTADHPLPVLEGMFTRRTFVKDINIGDRIPVTYKQYNEEIQYVDSDIAWLLGLILCDGCYDNGHVVISLGVDEVECINKVTEILNDLFPSSIYKIIDRRLDRNQNYMDIVINFNDNSTLPTILTMFEGIQKVNRHVPNEVFSWTRNAKVAFLAGMIDADGYTNYKKERNNGTRIQIGSTNKELAYGQMALAQCIGLGAKIYENHYTSKDLTKIRYRIEFPVSEELYSKIVLSKKKVLINGVIKTAIVKKNSFASVVSIESIDPDCLMSASYDVETESDMFEVSGILSHNCRTRVMGNVYDPSREISYGRGNLSFTTINLPMIALTANGDEDKFYQLLDKYLELAKKQLLERFEVQAKRKVKNYKFLMGQGIWIDSAGLNPDDEVREVIKHGSLTIGFVGLAETLVALYGHHHGEGKEYWDKGYAIIKHMRDYTDKVSNELKMNFGVLGSPAESYASKALRQCRKKFGIIEGVTDKDYFVNSNHLPPAFNVSAEEKIKLEAPFHELCNGGHICYIELDGDLTKNVKAIEKVIKMMHDNGVGYGAINHPVDRDPVCGYTGVINDECPNCHRHEDDTPFERIRRITGYLVGDLSRWNDGKKAEEKDRVKHTID